MPTFRTRYLAIALGTLVAVSGCGARSTETSAGDQRLQVVTASYPLQFAVEQVGGSAVQVRNLAKPGVDPHDLELTPREIGVMSQADLNVYAAGMSAAVDQVPHDRGAQRALDVNPHAQLTLRLEPASIAVASDHDHDHGANDEHEEHGAHDEHDEHGAIDPHFWLDPVRLAKVCAAIAQRLAELDPAHASTYRAGAERAQERLNALGTDLVTGLRSCATTQLVTSHAAFGYLAHRVGLHQVPIAGLSPGREPAAATLSAIARFVREQQIRTIYTEPLADPRLARSIATGTGAQTAVLDPIEGIGPNSAAQDYFGLMRANLSALKKGQHCS